MSRKNLILILSYAVLIMLVAYFMPRRLDWSPNYGSDKKEPLGTYLLYHQLHQLFPGENIYRSEMPLFNELSGAVDSNITYLIINHSFQPDEIDINYLLERTMNGANFFIASEYISYQLLDTLGIEIMPKYDFNILPFYEDTSRQQYYLSHKRLQGDSLNIPGVLAGSHMDVVSKGGLGALEVLGREGSHRINFFRLKIGTGYIFVHLTPTVFSNYSLLQEASSDYVSACLSYLPTGMVYWDDYYSRYETGNTSPLSVLMRYPPLKWVIYIAVFGTFLFMLFGAKRRQRAIPVLKAYTNDSLSFIQTLSAMHYNHRDNKLMADKRLSELRRVLLTKYRFRNLDFVSQETEMVVEASGIPEKTWKDLCLSVKEIKKTDKVSPEQLKKINDNIDSIYSYLIY